MSRKITVLGLAALFISAVAYADTQVVCLGAYDGEDQMYYDLDAQNKVHNVLVLNISSYFGNMNSYILNVAETDMQPNRENTRYELISEGRNSGFYIDVAKSIYEVGAGNTVMFDENGNELTYSCRK